MKKIILFTLLSFSIVHAYDNPPSLCYEGCTPWMLELEKDYNKAGILPYTPTVYSGDCKVLGGYDSDTTHHAVMMIDHKILPTRAIVPYFSVILSFFAGQNDFAHWDLTQARAEMSDYWKENGKLLFAEPTNRVEIYYADGSGPAYTYWIRYNALLREAYLITYMGVYSKMLCRLKTHDEIR